MKGKNLIIPVMFTFIAIIYLNEVGDPFSHYQVWSYNLQHFQIMKICITHFVNKHNMNSETSPDFRL